MFTLWVMQKKGRVEARAVMITLLGPETGFGATRPRAEPRGAAGTQGQPDSVTDTLPSAIMRCSSGHILLCNVNVYHLTQHSALLVPGFKMEQVRKKRKSPYLSNFGQGCPSQHYLYIITIEGRI